MSDVQSILRVYRKAAEANLRTPGRVGCVVHIGEPTGCPGDDVVVSADLHGHRVNLGRILKYADLEAQPRRHLVLQEVCHGGPFYPGTRACMSHLMLEDVARLKVQYPDRVHFLLSNHELAELIELAIVKGNRMLNLQFRFGMEQQYGEAAEEIRAAACEFIRSCPLAIRLSNRIWVSHSAPADLDLEAFDAEVFSRPLRNPDLVRGGAAFRLVWGRDFRQENADAFARLVDADLLVHGHEPCETGYCVPNTRQLVLDSSKSPACCLHVPLGAPPVMGELLRGLRFL
ncbi:MAG: hypothetical protein KDB14_08595 [Planctomycetales bacterium]|nr:hypothetical protein [Planctomycetales bacterium]